MCIFQLKLHLKAASVLFGRSAKSKVHPSWLAPSPIIGKCAVLPVCLDIVWGWPTPARVSNCTVTALVVQNVAICDCCQKALAVRTKSISVLSYSFGLVLSFTFWFCFKDKMLPAKLLLREVNFLCCARADISKGLEHCCQMNCLNENKLQLQNSASKLWPDRIDNWGSRNITKVFHFLESDEWLCRGCWWCVIVAVSHIEPLFAFQLESWLYLVCAMANASMESGDPVYGPAALAFHSQEIIIFHKILNYNLHLQMRQTQSLSVI